MITPGTPNKKANSDVQSIANFARYAKFIADQSFEHYEKLGIPVGLVAALKSSAAEVAAVSVQASVAAKKKMIQDIGRSEDSVPYRTGQDDQ